MADESGAAPIEGAEDLKGSEGASSADWRAGLSAELRGHPSLADIHDPEAAARTIIGAQEYMGRSIQIPSTDAAPEQREAFLSKLTEVPGVALLPDWDDEDQANQFYAKIGRPESPDEYQFERPEELPEGAQYDEEVDKWFAQTAHKYGLSSRQAKAIHHDFNQMMIEGWQEQHAATQKAAEALTREWGDQVDAHMGNISNLIDSTIENENEREGLKEELKANGIGNSPRLLKLLDKLAHLTLEDHMIRGAAPVEETLGDLDQRIGEVRDQLSSMPLSDPRRDSLLAKFDRLNKQKSDIQGGRAA